MSIHIGTSGWSYDHWQNVLYPEGTFGTERLNYYIGHFGTVELNSSYYHWPRDATFASWRRRVSDGFLMTVKAPRGLTHSKQLYAPEAWLSRIERSMGLLREKRGVLLVQLPPTFKVDMERLSYFLEQLPEGMRVTIEFRHHSWHIDEVFALIEKYNVAYCVMSGAHLPCILRATADFVYVRMHGPDTNHLYGGSYSDDDLRWWAEQLREWDGQGRDVFVYFNNDGEGNAVRNAWTLKGMVGQ